MVFEQNPSVEAINHVICRLMGTLGVMNRNHLLTFPVYDEVLRMRLNPENYTNDQIKELESSNEALLMADLNNGEYLIGIGLINYLSLKISRNLLDLGEVAFGVRNEP